MALLRRLVLDGLSLDWLSVTRMVANGGLAAIVLYTDYKFNRIYNRVIYPAILCGLVFAGVDAWLQAADHVSWWWWPLANSAGSGLLLFLVMLAIYVMGGVGGGDVKLVAAGGTILGFPMILSVVLYACLVGLAMGATAVIWKGKTAEFVKRSWRFRQLFRRQKLEDSVQLVPFGVAYAGGTLWAYLMLLLW